MKSPTTPPIYSNPLFIKALDKPLRWLADGRLIRFRPDTNGNLLVEFVGEDGPPSPICWDQLKASVALSDMELLSHVPTN